MEAIDRVAQATPITCPQALSRIVRFLDAAGMDPTKMDVDTLKRSVSIAQLTLNIETKG
jgi:hypothetical protein